MRRRTTRLAAGLVALACVGALAGCGDDASTSTDPVEVEVGKAFSWNGFSVEDGWTIKGIERSAGIDETVTTPEVRGTIKNTSEEERAALFQMVFSNNGSEVATLSCSAPKMVTDQSQLFICPGLSATMPEDYDAVVVEQFSRNTSSG